MSSRRFHLTRRAIVLPSKAATAHDQLHGCAVCETKDVCPDWKDPDSGYVAPAEACTSDAMLPVSFELATGKRFACECRSGDPAPAKHTSNPFPFLARAHGVSG